MKKVLVCLLIIVPILVVVVSLLWATGFFARTQVVNLVEVTRVPLHSTVSTNGKVEADHVTDLRAPLSGTCRLAGVHGGLHLRKGQEILRIDDPSLPSQLAAALAELDAAQADLRTIERGAPPAEMDQAKADLARAQLARDNAREVLNTDEWLLARAAITRDKVEQSRHALAVAQQDLEAAQARLSDLKSMYSDVDLRRARSRVEAAQARLQFVRDSQGRLIVRAPVEGTLYTLNVRDGAYLNTGDPIGLLADLKKLRVRAYVDEPDLGQVSVGEKVTIRWDAHPDEKWEGVVTRLPAEVVLLGTRTVAEVLCSIDSLQDTLMPNVNVDVEIQAPEGAPVNSLPRAVVLPEGSREFVWRIERGRAVKQYIQTGRSTTARIEITGGLSEGDKVIDPDDLVIAEGGKVRVRSDLR